MGVGGWGGGGGGWGEGWWMLAHIWGYVGRDIGVCILRAM